MTGTVFQKVAISVFGCLISLTTFPKHFANERNPTFPFDPLTGPQNNDPSSSSGFNLRSSLSRRQTAEPSGRTAFLQTLPTKCGDVSFFYPHIVSSSVFFCHSFSLHAPLTTYRPIDLYFSIIFPPKAFPFNSNLVDFPAVEIISLTSYFLHISGLCAPEQSLASEHKPTLPLRPFLLFLLFFFHVMLLSLTY